jgi:CheY-like chemotaxis protein
LSLTGPKAFESPWQNGVAERWVESCRRDLLDHVIAVNERHLKRLLSASQVLLVEDNLVNQKLADRLLTKRGHTVTIANDGEECVAILAERSFDFVLMDVQMPVMDGFEATRAIREKEKSFGGHVKIIAMTANSMQGDKEKCLVAGMDGYVSKPIRLPELLATMASLAPPSAAGQVPHDEASLMIGGRISELYRRMVPESGRFHKQ